MGKRINLLSALDENNNTIFIDEVDKKGLACNCHCPRL